MSELFDAMGNVTLTAFILLIYIVLGIAFVKVFKRLFLMADGLILGLTSSVFLFSMLRPTDVFKEDYNEKEFTFLYKLFYDILSPLRDSELTVTICIVLFILVPVITTILWRKFYEQQLFIDLILSGILSIQFGEFMYAGEGSWGTGNPVIFGFATGGGFFLYRLIRNLLAQKFIRDHISADYLQYKTFFMFDKKENGATENRNYYNSSAKKHGNTFNDNNYAKGEGFFNRKTNEYWHSEDAGSDERNRGSKNSANNKAHNTDDINMFAGCNSSDAVEKRYKDLAKVYHPDNQNGDTSTFQKINEEYEKAKNKF